MAAASDNVFPKVIVSEGAAPATPSSGQVKLYAKTDGLLYSKDDAGTETLVSGGTGGGGGITHAYVGYNTVGGSTETPTSYRFYMKKVTLASAGLIAAIEAYLYSNGTSANVASIPTFCIWTDNAGSPDRLVRASVPGAGDTLFLGNDANPDSTDGRWFGGSVNYYAASGDYWIGLGFLDINSMVMVYDGSGSDRYFTSGGNWAADSGLYSVTTSSNKYSIRASVIS